MKQKKTEIVTVYYEGWFGICPCWFEDAEHPIPKGSLWWLFDLAIWIEQERNWLFSWFTDSCEGFFLYLKELPEPKEVTLYLPAD